MIIKAFVNTSFEEIKSKKWNPYLGVSINNKVFTTEYLTGFINWAKDISKEGSAILIVDVIQHINNQVLNRSKPASALEKSFRKADEIYSMCEQAKLNFDENILQNLIIIDWTDIVYDEYFRHNLAVFKDEFENCQAFREALLTITKNNLGDIVYRFKKDEIKMLSQYILNELPELVTGFNYNGIHYNLNVYPGKIASIYADLLKLDFFQQILTKLKIIGEIASIEAYTTQ